MAKYTLEEIMYGDKYGIESAVFVEVFRMVEQKVNAKTIREQLNMIYVKHALLTAKRMIEEGDSISDIPDLESLSLRKEEKQCIYLKNSGMGISIQRKDPFKNK